MDLKIFRISIGYGFLFFVISISGQNFLLVVARIKRADSHFCRNLNNLKTGLVNCTYSFSQSFWDIFPSLD